MAYVYVLISQKDQKLYIGFTEDIKQRFERHLMGDVKSTKHRRPLDLVYYEYYCTREDALGREKFLKSGSGHRFLKKQLKYFFEKISRA